MGRFNSMGFTYKKLRVESLLARLLTEGTVENLNKNVGGNCKYLRRFGLKNVLTGATCTALFTASFPGKLQIFARIQFRLSDTYSGHLPLVSIATPLFFPIAYTFLMYI